MKKSLLLLSIVGFLGLGLLLTNVAVASEVEGILGTSQIETGISGTIMSAPTASPKAGTYSSTQSVTLSAPGSQSIRYTTDGSTPTCSGTQYVSPITVSSNRTIKAISCYPNGQSSSIASFVYAISKPVSSGGGGSSSGGSGGGTTYTPDTDSKAPDEKTPKAEEEKKPVKEPLLEKPISEMTQIEIRVKLIEVMELLLAKLEQLLALVQRQ